jgi:hypothetical protein
VISFKLRVAVLAVPALVMSSLTAVPGRASLAAPGPAPGGSLFGPAPAAAEPLPDTEPWELRHRFATVRWEMLRQLCAPAGDAGYDDLELNLFPDTTVTAHAVTVGHTDRADSVRWDGKVPDLPDSSVSLAAEGLCDQTPKDVSLAGTVDLDGRQFTIRPDHDGSVMITEVDPTAAGMMERPEKPPKKSDQAPRPPESEPEQRGTGGSVIDALILYTPGAVAEAHGKDQIEAWITDAATRANESLRASGVHARVRVLDMREATGYKGPETVEGAFSRLTRPGDGVLDEAQKLRDQVGADIVTTVVRGYNPRTMVAGLASYPERPHNPQTAGEAYAVVAANQLWGVIMAHEWGHLFGLDHDWTTSPDKSAAFPDNHGFVTPDRKYVTIMGYPSACAPHACAYTPYFANPGLRLKGQALGVRLGSGARSADNARVMNITAPQLAAYRRPRVGQPANYLSVTVSPPGAGSVTPDTPAPYDTGDSVKVTATPASGYRFAGWTLDGKAAGQGGGNSLNVTLAGSRKVVARFEPGASAQYRLTTKASNSEAGLVRVDPPGGTFSEGSQVNATAVPKKGYDFMGWSIDGRPAGDDPTLTLKMTRPHLIVARFGHAARLTTWHKPIGGGLVAQDGDGVYAVGAKAAVQARPARGYVFDHWILDTVPMKSSKPVITVTVTGARDIVAVFRRG